MACYPKWEELIIEASKTLIADLFNFSSHSYEISKKHQKIGYKDQDQIVYNISYGYQTMFAYYNEVEKGNFKRSEIEGQIALNINCGIFSYSEVSKKFDLIMGLTGTLQTLTEPEKDVIKGTYHISRFTYAPSVFGVNPGAKFEEDDVKIFSLIEYFIKLENEISNRLVGKNPGTKRAVLVFFESKKKLMEFYESSAMNNLRDYVKILTEDASSAEKDKIISCATLSGAITFLTRAFGRGTDFICRDLVVKANGGVHVIQAFLSEELSEETQIRGRTARQGDPGSFSMVLCMENLQKFMIEPEEISDRTKREGFFNRIGQYLKNLVKGNGSLYDLLNLKRSKLFLEHYNENSFNLTTALQSH